MTTFKRLTLGKAVSLSFRLAAGSLAPACLSLATATPAVATTTAADDLSADQLRIQEIEEQLGRLVDPSDVRKYYAEDAILYDALAPGFTRGAAAIEQSFAAQLKGVKSVRTKFLQEKITVNEELAVAYSLQAITVVMDDGAERQVVCRITDIFRKKNEEWRIVHQHISYPADATNGQAQFALTPQL